MPGSVPSIHRFDDFDRVVDDIHALFDAWCDEDAFADTIGEFGLHVMKLAVHEWIANLVQHAAFSKGTPTVRFYVQPEADGVHCAIEDNSDGFDFQSQLSRQNGAVFGPEPSERGRGLLMLIACTEDLAYGKSEDGFQRLEFVIRAPVPTESMAPLFSSDHPDHS